MAKVIRSVAPEVQRKFNGVGQRLRLSRMQKGMSLVEMAERTGISRDTLHRLERGDASISISALLTVFSILGLEADLDRIGADALAPRPLQDMPKARRRRGPSPGDRALPQIRREDLLNFAQRDWPAVAELKTTHWMERKQLFGPEEAFRVAEDLRRYAATVRPDWPDEQARASDVASHVAVGEGLRSVRSIRAR